MRRNSSWIGKLFRLPRKRISRRPLTSGPAPNDTQLDTDKAVLRRDTLVSHNRLSSSQCPLPRKRNCNPLGFGSNNRELRRLRDYPPSLGLCTFDPPGDRTRPPPRPIRDRVILEPARRLRNFGPIPAASDGDGASSLAQGFSTLRIGKLPAMLRQVCTVHVWLPFCDAKPIKSAYSSLRIRTDPEARLCSMSTTST